MTSIKFIFNKKKSQHLNIGPSASELRHKALKLGRENVLGNSCIFFSRKIFKQLLMDLNLQLK